MQNFEFLTESGRPHSSPVWDVSKAEMEKLIEQYDSLGELMAHFGLKNHGGNYNTMVRRFNADNIDWSKFKGNYGKGTLKPYRSLDEILVEDCNFSRSHLKKRLLKEGLLENKCDKCGQEPEWNGEKLVMVLDHRNGVNNDNRLENLRLLCPNCNSQTTTFAGKNKTRMKKYSEWKSNKT